MGRASQVRGGLAHLNSLLVCPPALAATPASASSPPPHPPTSRQRPQISQQLLTLRQLLPTADVAALVAAHPPVLFMAEEELDDALETVREVFPEASQVGWGGAASVREPLRRPARWVGAGLSRAAAGWAGQLKALAEEMPS